MAGAVEDNSCKNAVLRTSSATSAAILSSALPAQCDVSGDRLWAVD